MVREPNATMRPAHQDNQLMSQHRVFSFKPQPRLQWRGEDSQHETEKPDHHASLGDSNAASHSDEVFGTHSGWRPVADQIDPEIPQRTLSLANFAVDLIAFPDEPGFYSPPTLLIGRGDSGDVEATGRILWIDVEREWAICDDAVWWTP